MCKRNTKADHRKQREGKSMSNLKHYFENMLFMSTDISCDLNKKKLTQEQIDAVNECVDYVIYSLFNDRDDFNKFIWNHCRCEQTTAIDRIEHYD